MVIGIDMDDTICSTNELIIVQADKYDKEVLGGTGEKEMKGQFFKDRLEYIMSHAEIKPGAKEVINRLHDEGNKIIIISFRKGKYLEDPSALTKEWLERYGIKYDKIYTDTGSKVDECLENNVKLFIDDKESHCEDVSNAGVDVILFTNAYNHAENRFVRKDNWNDIYDYIKEKYNG